ncbi:MAG: purine-nucleoside phosphorylase [Bacilli bacterium]|nr:purine-nucleoside phosphorylase [Bacilli bacterium]
MSTPHNSARDNAFAKTVLMPGDPLRAKYIAENFLEDVEQVTSVRNMFGYTGTYKGKRVSVMGSGMGMPSIGIYATELFKFYGVENIIRVGSCGSYQENIDLYDVILVQGCCTDSNFAYQYNLKGGTFSAISNFELLHKAYTVAQEKKMPVHVGNVVASDVFYGEESDSWKRWQKMGVLGVEMESYALFAIAARLNKKALTILTVSDSLVSHKETSSEERERNFNQMIEIALEIA